MGDKQRRKNGEEVETAIYVPQDERCRGSNASLGPTTKGRGQAAVTLPWPTIYGNVERDMMVIMVFSSHWTVISIFPDCEASLSAEAEAGPAAEERKEAGDDRKMMAQLRFHGAHGTPLAWKGDKVPRTSMQLGVSPQVDGPRDGEDPQPRSGIRIYRNPTNNCLLYMYLTTLDSSQDGKPCELDQSCRGIIPENPTYMSATDPDQSSWSCHSSQLWLVQPVLSGVKECTERCISHRFYVAT